MANHLSFVTLDVFTSTRYTGNPLALVKVPRHIALSQSQKQRIAREFNLSETVFLHEQTPADIAEDDHAARVDIFTAHAEVPFAGHPTVGTANYLLRLLGDDAAGKNVKALRAKAGRIPITLDPAADGVQISVAHNVHVHNAPYAGKPFGQYPVVSIVRGMTFILARLPDLAALAAATENLVGRDATYTSAPGLDAGWREGIVVTYFFVDTSGPRTPPPPPPRTPRPAPTQQSGGACGPGRAGRHRYAIVQGVEMGQRSEIFVDVGVRPAAAADGGRLEIEEVLLSGSAVQVMQGSLEVPAPDGLS
ncbi:hypothetical protein CLAIMM_13951 [Cladophialophora immunda]|nr:hypothetical protein CLAIMM_13951 [Cladophialophora immunda]